MLRWSIRPEGAVLPTDDDSDALAGGRTLAEVRAAGHASVLTTSVYLHVAVDYDEEVEKLLEFGG
ncbi:MAG TPA: hypothetical protein VK395_20570 [Gemmataceae bacterium]|nr:hypothetical protein [Gemmataceae bacterium]